MADSDSVTIQDMFIEHFPNTPIPDTKPKTTMANALIKVGVLKKISSKDKTSIPMLGKFQILVRAPKSSIIDIFPLEVLVKILSYTDFTTIGAFTSTCKQSTRLAGAGVYRALLWVQFESEVIDDYDDHRGLCKCLSRAAYHSINMSSVVSLSVGDVSRLSYLIDYPPIIIKYLLHQATGDYNRKTKKVCLSSNTRIDIPREEIVDNVNKIFKDLHSRNLDKSNNYIRNMLITEKVWDGIDDILRLLYLKKTPNNNRKTIGCLSYMFISDIIRTGREFSQDLEDIYREIVDNKLDEACLELLYIKNPDEFRYALDLRRDGKYLPKLTNEDYNRVFCKLIKSEYYELMDIISPFVDHQSYQLNVCDTPKMFEYLYSKRVVTKQDLLGMLDRSDIKTPGWDFYIEKLIDVCTLDDLRSLAHSQRVALILGCLGSMRCAKKLVSTGFRITYPRRIYIGYGDRTIHYFSCLNYLLDNGIIFRLELCNPGKLFAPYIYASYINHGLTIPDKRKYIRKGQPKPLGIKRTPLIKTGTRFNNVCLTECMIEDMDPERYVKYIRRAAKYGSIHSLKLLIDRLNKLNIDKDKMKEIKIKIREGAYSTMRYIITQYLSHPRVALHFTVAFPLVMDILCDALLFSYENKCKIAFLIMANDDKIPRNLIKWAINIHTDKWIKDKGLEVDVVDNKGGK